MDREKVFKDKKILDSDLFEDGPPTLCRLMGGLRDDSSEKDGDMEGCASAQDRLECSSQSIDEPAELKPGTKNA